MHPAAKFSELLATISGCFKHFFSEARGFAALKVGLFIIFIAFLGAGVVVDGRARLGGGQADGQFRFSMDGPGTAAMVIAGLGLIVLVGANMWTVHRRREAERELYKLLADPNLHPQVRDALLKKL